MAIRVDVLSKGQGIGISRIIDIVWDERSRLYFKDGFYEMLKRLTPDAIVIYGDVNDYLLSIMPKQLEMRHIVHERFNRARRHGK